MNYTFNSFLVLKENGHVKACFVNMNLDDETFEILACCSVQDFMIPFHTMCPFLAEAEKHLGATPFGCFHWISCPSA